MYNEKTNKYEGYIYCIYNKLNNKNYIGQTIRTIDIRYKDHISMSKNHVENSPFLYRDAKFYGWDMFVVYEVEKNECKTKEELCDKLNDREIYYINCYNSLYPNGYNITIGGDANSIRNMKKVYQFDLYGNLIAEFNSLIEASEKTNVLSSVISSCCNGRYVTGGNYYWNNEPVFKEEIKNRRLKTIIVKYDLNGNLIKIYNSISDAKSELPDKLKDINSVSSTISKCAIGKSKTAYGFIWHYYEDVIDGNGEVLNKLSNEEITRVSTKNIETFFKRPVCQFDTNRNYICKYESIKEASNKTDVGYASIQACAAGRQKTGGGYYWMYYDEYLKTLNKGVTI